MATFLFRYLQHLLLIRTWFYKMEWLWKQIWVPVSVYGSSLWMLLNNETILLWQGLYSHDLQDKMKKKKIKLIREWFYYFADKYEKKTHFLTSKWVDRPRELQYILSFFLSQICRPSAPEKCEGPMRIHNYTCSPFRYNWISLCSGWKHYPHDYTNR